MGSPSCVITAAQLANSESETGTKFHPISGRGSFGDNARRGKVRRFDSVASGRTCTSSIGGEDRAVTDDVSFRDRKEKSKCKSEWPPGERNSMDCLCVDQCRY